MKHVLLVLACLVIPSIVIGAPADSSAVKNTRPNSLQAGAWAIQFTAIDGFSGGGALIKRHRNPGHAFRLGLEFSLDSRSGDFTEDTTSVAVGKGTVENDYFNVNASLISQHYLNLQAPAHVYLGVGPFVSFSEYHNEEEMVVLGERRARSNDRDTLRVGAILILGAEWFASRSLSLAVEYGVSAGYASSVEEFSNQFENGPVDHQKQDLTGWFAGGGDARFALGIYF
jgi:hypothetical protein